MAVRRYVRRSLLMEPAESDSLGDAFAERAPRAEALYASGDYTGMLQSLAPLKLPVDRFFDEVMVNVDDETTARQPARPAGSVARDHEPRGRHLAARGRLSLTVESMRA